MTVAELIALLEEQHPHDEVSLEFPASPRHCPACDEEIDAAMPPRVHYLELEDTTTTLSSWGYRVTLHLREFA